jgi:molybdenum cofactor guanylyltransferase
MRRAGFVLVGGKSSRMGRDKALLPYRGATLVQHVASCVLAAAGSATLVGHPERYHTLGLPLIPDLSEGRGPLSGIEAALRFSNAEWNLVVACDMPRITVDALRAILDEAERSGADCLMPLSAGDRPEPLCAAYRRTCLPAISKALTEGILKVRAALERTNVMYWKAPEGAFFDNLNTPAEWAHHREAASGPLPGKPTV